MPLADQEVRNVFRRIVSLLIAFPLGAALVAIAVSNRQPVQLILDPFRPEAPALSVSLPFYAYLLGALVLGVILGGLATWMGQSRWRRTARTQGQRATRFQAEADRLARERDAHVSSGAGATKSLAVAGR
jgi:uncharacterized integral membrane protein